MLKFFLVAHLTYENQWVSLRNKIRTFGLFGTPYSAWSKLLLFDLEVIIMSPLLLMIIMVLFINEFVAGAASGEKWRFTKETLHSTLICKPQAFL